MKNTQQIIILLEKAVKLSSDNQEIKNKLKNVLSHVQIIHKKQEQNKKTDLTPIEKWHLDIETASMKFGNPKETLKRIEQMIEEEKAKITQSFENEKVETILE